MENATKALLIAAAVLIAILIISLGIVVYNMASETMGDVNLNEAEATQFNGKFKAYEGTAVSGSKVNAMLNTVLQHNINNTDQGKKVTVDGDISLGTNATSVETKADTGSTYKVTCKYTPATGLINAITVTKKTTNGTGN